MKLRIVSAGLSAALINKNTRKGIESLMNFDDQHEHVPLLFVPKDAAPDEDARKLQLTPDDLRNRLRNELIEKFTRDHVAYNVKGWDIRVEGSALSNELVYDATPVDGCNHQEDWTSLNWIARLKDMVERTPEFKLDQRGLGNPRVASATLELQSGRLSSHPPVEPAPRRKFRLVKREPQEFTDAMEWLEEYADTVSLVLTRRGQNKPATIKLSGDADCYLLNLPKPLHGSFRGHVQAYRKIPFASAVQLVDPMEEGRCNGGPELERAKQPRHVETADDVVKVHIEIPVSLLQQQETIVRISAASLQHGQTGLTGHDSDQSGAVGTDPLGESLCMRCVEFFEPAS